MSVLRGHLIRLRDSSAHWLADYSVLLLRISLGLIFLGFGVLKLFPGMSPAEPLVEETVGELSLGFLSESQGLFLVATLETVIGLCLLLGRCLRLGVALLGLAMIGILSPLVLVPEELFNPSTFAPTLAGQYVLKDIVLLTAGLVVTANVCGARMVTGRGSRRSRQSSSHAGRRADRPRRPRAVADRRPSRVA